MTRSHVGSFATVVVMAMALGGCSDSDSGDTDAGRTTGAGGGAGAASGSRDPLSGGRAPESGVTVIALTLPETQLAKSKVARIDPSAGPFDCDVESDAGTDTDAGTDSCDGNAPPLLGAPVYEINGLLYDELPEQLGATDEVLVLVPFEDADCNLACGTHASGFGFRGATGFGGGAAGGSGANRLPSDVPCGTEDSGVYLGLYSPALDLGTPGEFGFALTVSDACGAEGERIDGSFRIE